MNVMWCYSACPREGFSLLHRDGKITNHILVMNGTLKFSDRKGYIYYILRGVLLLLIPTETGTRF